MAFRSIATGARWRSTPDEVSASIATIAKHASSWNSAKARERITFYTADLTAEYVRLNADYHTLRLMIRHRSEARSTDSLSRQTGLLQLPRPVHFAAIHPVYFRTIVPRRAHARLRHQATHRRLSVAMIVARRGRACRRIARSVRDVADEIVVVDTGSTDRTREVALQACQPRARLRVVRRLRRRAKLLLGQVTGEWVFWLDAGETISAEAAHRLRTFVDAQT